MAEAAVAGLAFPDEKKKYIVDVLDPVLEQMVQELLGEMPPKPVEFMLQWLKKRAGGKYMIAGSGRMGLQEMNAHLKKELSSMRGFVAEAAAAAGEQGRRKVGADDDASEEEEEDDTEDATPMPPPPVKRGPRASVSAEAYGTWNQVKPFTPPKHPKSEEQTSRLRDILSRSFLFNSLEKKDLDTVLLAMVEKTFEAGSRIITEGEDGDHLYVIETGAPVCKKQIGGENKTVKQYEPGGVFGELALLYNCPRAATIEATDTCKCWQLDRETFNHIVKDAATKRSEQHEGFLKRVDLLSSMDKYERAQICDALKVERFVKDDWIVRQSEPGDTFYIVEEGSLVAVKTVNGEDAQTVMEYGSGDYFGELALLKNQPRAAGVKVTSGTAKVLSLDRKSFVKMLGPVEELLHRKQNEYR